MSAYLIMQVMQKEIYHEKIQVSAISVMFLMNADQLPASGTCQTYVIVLHEMTWPSVAVCGHQILLSSLSLAATVELLFSG